MGNWLETHREFQESTYGTRFDDFKTDYAARSTFVLWNRMALLHELVEAGDETPWKPWSSRDPKEMWDQNRDRYLAELVDIKFFLANLALAVDATDEEFDQLYAAKTTVNVKRQQTGYDSFATKCVRCRRELDKEGAYETLSAGDPNQVPGGRVYLLRCTACQEKFDFYVKDGSYLP